MMKFVIPKVFEVYPIEGVELVCPIKPYDYENFVFDGSPRKVIWKPTRVEIVREDLGRKFVPGDLPSSSVGDLVVSRKAKDMIGAFLEQYGELLPLVCDDREFWTLNVTCMIDALDETKSVLHRSKQDGSILIISKYAFHPEALKTATIFRLPQYARGSFYVTTPFVELIKSSGLTGLTFKQIWAPD